MTMRLLIAEDEVDLAEALTAFFEKNHFSVDAVHNGADAYEYAVSGGYDAVILDVMMPRMNGIQVLERLRAERIMERVWGWDNEAEINVVWVNISNLRKKLRAIGSRVTLRANRGLGYVLEEET
jgi:DNA-binding response OmpR family regulator